jgi:hypothetical protein
MTACPQFGPACIRFHGWGQDRELLGKLSFDPQTAIPYGAGIFLIMLVFWRLSPAFFRLDNSGRDKMLDGFRKSKPGKI